MIVTGEGKGKNEAQQGSLHSNRSNALCDLIVSHMPENLEKGNGLILRFLFSEIHCKLFLFSFLSHYLYQHPAASCCVCL